jgi:hypothetical protein
MSVIMGTEHWFSPTVLIKTIHIYAVIAVIKHQTKLSSWSWALLEKPPICAGTQELPTILWNLKIQYCVHNSNHWTLSWARSIQSIQPHPIPLRSISILSTHQRLGIPSGLFPPGFPTNILYASLFSPFVFHALPISSPWLDHSNYTWWRVQVIKLLIIKFSLTSLQFISLWSTCSLQHLLLKHPQALVLP